MQDHPQRRPSAALVISILALILAASGTALAATGLVAGNRLIKPNSLSGNRLVSHSVTGKQIDLARLGTVPSSNATKGYFSSGLVTMSGIGAGVKKTILTTGPFSYVAFCDDQGGGYFAASLAVKDNSVNGAVEEDTADLNNTPPSTLNKGASHNIFYGASSNHPDWSAGYVNTFSVAAPNGHAYSGLGSMGVNVLGHACAFQLVVFGS
jgi:hypothetical protein